MPADSSSAGSGTFSRPDVEPRGGLRFGGGWGSVYRSSENPRSPYNHIHTARLITKPFYVVALASAIFYTTGVPFEAIILLIIIIIIVLSHPYSPCICLSHVYRASKWCAFKRTGTKVTLQTPLVLLRGTEWEGMTGQRIVGARKSMEKDSCSAKMQ